MAESMFTIKIYRGGVSKPSSVEFHSCNTPRIVDLKNELNEFEIKKHEAFLEKGATHIVDVVVNDRIDNLYIFEKDVMFIESPQGHTIYSINRKS